MDPEVIGKGPEVPSSGMQLPLQIPPALVKYDPPIFAGLEPSPEPNSQSNDEVDPPTIGSEGRGAGMGRGVGVAGGRRGRVDGREKTSQLDDMLNSMLPPREWTEETGTWMQYVSKEPATRLAVITLQVKRELRGMSGRKGAK